MSRYIDADEIVYFNDTGEDRPIEAALVAYKGQIDRIPSADVAPVVHGHWRKVSKFEYECSNCKDIDVFSGDIKEYKYCYNCGAKMDEEGSEDSCI